MKHPRVIVAAVAAGLAAPLLLWLGITATTGGPDQTTLADSSAQDTVSARSAASLESQAAEGDRVTPVAEPSAAPTDPPPPDPLATTSSPRPRPTDTQTPSATPTPAVTPPAPAPSPQVPSSVEEASPTPTATPKASPSPSRKPTPKATPSQTAQSPQAPTPEDSERPSQKPPRKTTKPQGGWRAPQLTTGVNQLWFPMLSSGADVTITVACQPSDGCAMDAGTLTIEPGSSVTVTWSAPRTRTHTAWSVQRTFN